MWVLYFTYITSFVPECSKRSAGGQESLKTCDVLKQLLFYLKKKKRVTCGLVLEVLFKRCKIP